MSNHEIPLRRIDTDAQFVLRRLVQADHEAYLVGGCVRDLLLERTPKDIDIATSATPSQIRGLFRNCRIIGRRFRLAHVVFGSKIIEVATFRKNPQDEVDPDEDTDHQKDLLIEQDNVFGTAREDAWRRDFTVNGLFYDLVHGKVIDHVRGKKDLAAHQLRTIGDPDVRFQEDPVRMLRAVRLAARLGFEIEDHTFQSLLTQRQALRKSAPARIIEEIYRFFRRGALYESMVLLKETGLLSLLLPRLDQALGQNPVFLDVFLQQIDAWANEGESIEIPTILFLLGAPDLLFLIQPESAELTFDQRREHIEEGINRLQHPWAFPQKDLKRLGLFLLNVPFPRRSRPRFFKAYDQERWFEQLMQLFSVLPGFSTQMAADIKPVRRRTRKRVRRPPSQTTASGHDSNPPTAPQE